VIVVDASAVVARLFDLRPAAMLDHEDLHAPEICDLEVASFLTRELRGRRLSPTRVAEAASDYVALPLRLHGHRPLLRRCLGLSDNFTVYDASYVALAEHLGAPLLTLDRSLARAVTDHTGVQLAATERP
jgi:predicted nucleic acid-binding protein